MPLIKIYIYRLFFFLMLGMFPIQFIAQQILVEQGIQIKEFWIPMADGTKLAADLYMPDNIKAGEKYPILLEYLPYRKDEGRGGRFPLFSYFIKNGYIVARVDIRGTGRSEGKLVDGEYSEQEQEDGEVVIDWLSKQTFSTGTIGMFGISWGGFNSLHLAMRRPPALKTIISLMSTDDIYEDDVHFMDGMMHVDAYELDMDISNAVPGAPEFKIDEEYFKNRFDTNPWFMKYKKQQTDGPFWNRASLNEDYSKIDIPIFIIGGWYDGYRDFIPRMMANADVPIKAMLGPWNHTWPNWAYPEPAIEWRDMVVRWFDLWLKGVDNGIMKEPNLYYFQRDWHAPGLDLTEIPGTWKQSNTWPKSKDSLLFLNENHTLGNLPSNFKHDLNYKASVGPEASGSVMWWGDWAPDQKNADVNCLVYESQPIKDSLEILGFPKVILQTSVNAPSANWIVRLSDVAPNGMVTLITGAGFNATHYKSSEQPSTLVPDSLYTLNIELHATSWTFRKGHKIRLAINNALWPMIWPSPYPMTTTLHSEETQPSFLKLPIPPPSVENLKTPFFKPVEDPELSNYKSIASETLSGYAEIKEVIRNEHNQTTTLIATNSGSDQYPWGIGHYSQSITHMVNDNDPAKTRLESTYSISVEKEEHLMKWTGILYFSSDENFYYYDYTRKLEDNGTLIRQKNWNEKIPRM